MNPNLRFHLLALIAVTLSACAIDAPFKCRFCTPVHLDDSTWLEAVRKRS